MIERKIFNMRLHVLLMLVFLFVILLLVNISFNPTSSRYIKQEKDEILALYTSLYFNSDRNHMSMSLEDNKGYVNFKLMNYIGEDVTQRDIEYIIEKPSKFYNSKGEVMENPSGEEDLYVLDVWGKPKKIGNDTYKYQSTIVQNDGEISDGGNYTFLFEKLGSSAVGKTHNLTIQMIREESTEMTRVENVSVVVQLIKPYREVFIIDILVSNRLIVFSQTVSEVFETQNQVLYIQSSNIYSHYKSNGEYYPRTANINGEVYEYTSKAFLVTIYWDHVLLNLHMLDDIHIGIGENPSNLDITKPYIVDVYTQKDRGYLEIYIPQASNFHLNFLPTTTAYTIDAKIEVCVRKNDGLETYVLYDEQFGGYEHIKKANLPNKNDENVDQEVVNLVTK